MAFQVDRLPPTGDTSIDINSPGAEINSAVFEASQDVLDAAGFETARSFQLHQDHELYPMWDALQNIWNGRRSDNWPNTYFGTSEMDRDAAVVDEFCRG